MNNISTYIFENHIDIAAASIGLLYLYLEYKASVWMWLASIVMAVFFVYIFYSTQLYANMVIYIYFFGASIYGWISWMTKSRDKETGRHIILRMPRTHTTRIALLTGITFLAISLILYYTTDNKTIVSTGDALITALNIVALWMASRKWAEQWCLLIPANLMSGILLFIQGEPASSVMFFVYFIVSIFGYQNWKKMATSVPKEY